MAETTTYITVQQKYRSLLKSCKNLISTEDIRLVRKAFDTAMSSEANLRAVTEKERVREEFYYLIDVAPGNRVRNVEIGTDKNGIWRKGGSDISRFTGYKPYLRYSPGGGFRKFPEITTEFC